MDSPRPPFGIDAMMNTTMDYFRKAWSSFNLPTQLAPTVDIAELDKRINNLKAVESWLNLNLTMLRTTIQGLEIQRGTIAAISTIGQAVDQTGNTFTDWARQARTAGANLVNESTASAMAAATSPLSGTRRGRTEAPEPPAAPPPAAPVDDEAAGTGSSGGLSPLASSFFSMFAPLSGATRPDPASAETEAEPPSASAAEPHSRPAGASRSGVSPDWPLPPAGPTAEAPPEVPAEGAQAGAAAASATGTPDADAAAGGGTTAPMAGATNALAEGLAAASAQFINPTAWWNMLQSQFSQIVQATAPASGGGGAATESPAPSRGKGAAKAAPKGGARGAKQAGTRDGARKSAAKRSPATAGARPVSAGAGTGGARKSPASPSAKKAAPTRAKAGGSGTSKAARTSKAAGSTRGGGREES